MWTRWSVVAAAAVLVTASALIAPARAEESPATTAVSLRVSYDQDSCAARAGVYLDRVADTISGFELVLLWNRPDVYRFTMKTTATPRLDDGDTAAPPDSVLAPVIRSDSGLIRDWAYVECRGTTGHMARVIGLAQLVNPDSTTNIVPGDSGLLFEILLERVAHPAPRLDDESVFLEVQPHVSQMSTAQGLLIHDINFSAARMLVRFCHE